MTRISTIAKWTQNLLLFGIVPATIFLRLLSWAKIDQNILYIKYEQMQAHIIERDVTTLPIVGKLLFFVLESLSPILLLMAAWYFFKILQQYKHGVFFSKEIVSLLKKINTIVLIWAVYKLFFSTFASLLISIFQPAGQRYITFAVSFDDLMHFFILMILFMILYLIQEAYKLRSEQDLLV